MTTQRDANWPRVFGEDALNLIDRVGSLLWKKAPIRQTLCMPLWLGSSCWIDQTAPLRPGSISNNNGGRYDSRAQRLASKPNSWTTSCRTCSHVHIGSPRSRNMKMQPLWRFYGRVIWWKTPNVYTVGQAFMANVLKGSIFSNFLCFITGGRMKPFTKRSKSTSCAQSTAHFFTSADFYAPLQVGHTSEVTNLLWL